MSDEYAELHKQIDQLEIDQDAKVTLHKDLKDAKEDPSLFEKMKNTIEEFFKSSKESESTPEPEPEPPKTSKNKRGKADIVLKKDDLPDNCYLEINCEGKKLTVELPDERTDKPIRIRPKGEGTLVLRLSDEHMKTHKIDRSQRGYKFTDLHWLPGVRTWQAIDKFDPT